MDPARPPLADTIVRFREALRELGIRAERVILFGSHARGEATEGSDIDLLVVSTDFRNLGLRERLELLGTAVARVWQPIEAIGCTPDEAANPDRATFLEEVLNTGVRVA